VAYGALHRLRRLPGAPSCDRLSCHLGAPAYSFAHLVMLKGAVLLWASPYDLELRKGESVLAFSGLLAR
jgi:hypothetical protein